MKKQQSRNPKKAHTTKGRPSKGPAKGSAKQGPSKQGRPKYAQPKQGSSKQGRSYKNQGEQPKRAVDKSKQASKPEGSNRHFHHKADPKVTPPCPYFKQCGACQLQDITYEASLTHKHKRMSILLKEFAKVKPVIGMEDPWHYRNKSHATFSFARKGVIHSGLYMEQSHEVVPIDNCLIQDERADAIVRTIQDLVVSFKMSVYDEFYGRGFLRHVLIKVGHSSQEVMVVLVVTSHMFKGKNNFLKALRQAHPEITTIIQNVNDQDTSMVLGDREIILYGKGYIEDQLCGMTFRISAKSFYQINPIQTEILYKKAMDMAQLTGKETVLDAYSGIGTIGLVASQQAKLVVGVELNKDAVKDAIINSKINGRKNARFFEGDAGKFMVELAKEGERLDVVFMDPPRSGSSPEFIRAIGQAKPSRVVYISCGPDSLARDLKLLEKEGYKVQEIQPVDMFPWTEHVETVVNLVKK